MSLLKKIHKEANIRGQEEEVDVAFQMDVRVDLK
jgi:hypothetical protein